MSEHAVLDDAIAYLEQNRAVVAIVPWCGSIVTLATVITADQLPDDQAEAATSEDRRYRAAFLVLHIARLRWMLDDTFGVKDTL